MWCVWSLFYPPDFAYRENSCFKVLLLLTPSAFPMKNALFSLPSKFLSIGPLWILEGWKCIIFKDACDESCMSFGSLQPCCFINLHSPKVSGKVWKRLKFEDQLWCRLGLSRAVETGWRLDRPGSAGFSLLHFLVWRWPLRVQVDLVSWYGAALFP